MTAWKRTVNRCTEAENGQFFLPRHVPISIHPFCSCRYSLTGGLELLCSENPLGSLLRFVRPASLGSGVKNTTLKYCEC